MDTLGIVAGSGNLPLQSARAARTSGTEVIIYSLDSSADYPGFPVRKVSLLHFGGLLQALKKDGVQNVQLLGKVSKAHLNLRRGMDAFTLRLYLGMKNRSDMELFRVMLREYERRGITIHAQDKFLKHLLARGGLGARPAAKLRADLEFAAKSAMALAELDIGQSVVCAARSVVAVEALEGTDEMIRRSSPMLGHAAATAVFAKAARPSQDRRFDMPAFGTRTLEILKEAAIRQVILEAGSLFITDPEEVDTMARKYRISVATFRRSGTGSINIQYDRRMI